MTSNPYLNEWVKKIAQECQPDQIHWMQGTEEEKRLLEHRLVETGTCIPLNETLRPNSFLARSHPDDVARVEDRTFICSINKEDAGPTNNWKDPNEMKGILKGLFAGCMRGRTLYVIPYCMGPIGSPYSRIAVQISDSPYVALSMCIMTHVGKEALEMLQEKPFVKCLHSVGKPKLTSDQDDRWPCNPAQLYIAHFPETREVMSFGSGYGGNALLNKKCFALRIASTMAREEGWMAEHMLIVGVTNPEGKKRYFAASFPSACGKTNLAMMLPTIPGWKVECVGDDIAWMNWRGNQLVGINPESGFFGVAPGTSYKSNPNAMRTIEKNTIFTNVALTDDNDVWWEGMTESPPSHLISWKGADWTPTALEKSSHPNARFTVAASQCPVIDPSWQDLGGVPISGIIFGGRRATTIPLVREALNWKHGVFLGATMTSETTAAAKGAVGQLRHDPFAMLPFCGYNMGDYFASWLSQEQPGRKMPAIFYVNWFQKDQEGKFLWPGFGENSRILKWCFERVEGKLSAIETPIGYVPKQTDLDLTGLDISQEAVARLFAVLPTEWRKEIEESAKYLEKFGQKLPLPLLDELKRLKTLYA